MLVQKYRPKARVLWPLNLFVPFVTLYAWREGGTDSLMSQCNEREYCDNQCSKHQRHAAHAAFLLNYSPTNLVSRHKNKSCHLNKFTWRHLLKFKYIRCKYAEIGQASGFDSLENRNAIFTLEFGTYLWILNFTKSIAILCII